MRRRRSRPSANPVEALEARVLLSGNVQAEVVGDTLFITGDEAGNSIFVDEGAYCEGDHTFGSGHTVYPSPKGASIEGENGTTVNGGTDKVFFTGFTNIVVDLAGGDDRFQTAYLAVDGDVTINTGWGADQVQIHQIELEGSLHIETGSGDDSVWFGGAVASVTSSMWNHFPIIYSGLCCDPRQPDRQY